MPNPNIIVRTIQVGDDVEALIAMGWERLGTDWLKISKYNHPIGRALWARMQHECLETL